MLNEAARFGLGIARLRAAADGMSVRSVDLCVGEHGAVAEVRARREERIAGVGSGRQVVALRGSEHRIDTSSSPITTTFLAMLNAGAGFAGHTDWRIPNENELQTLVNYENHNPAVDTVFNTNCAPGCTVLTCSCTTSGGYWSSTGTRPAWETPGR